MAVQLCRAAVRVCRALLLAGHGAGHLRCSGMFKQHTGCPEDRVPPTCLGRQAALAAVRRHCIGMPSECRIAEVRMSVVYPALGSERPTGPLSQQRLILLMGHPLAAYNPSKPHGSEPHEWARSKRSCSEA
jgi:hypothetical protein